MKRETVVVLDFGGQYNQLIARRVRECGVYCEIHSYKTDLEKILAIEPKGIIFTGGPMCILKILRLMQRKFMIWVCLFCGLSGGVDSSVAAVMLSKAVEKQLTCVFVDHGLLRKKEEDEVESIFGPQGEYDLNFVRMNAKERFYEKLKGVEEPEEKRKIIGEVTPEKVEIVQEADAIWREEIEKAGLDEELGKYFAALTNMRSVGVMGDERTYDYAVALREVTTTDFMTAEVTEIPWEVIVRTSSRIVNEVKGVNRCLLDITGKPPATIEIE